MVPGNIGGMSWSGWWIYRRRGWDATVLPRPLLWTLTTMTFAGWLATLAGWYVTEIGRQPFIVHGLVRTADIASKVPSAMIASTLALYIVLYVALIVAYIAVIQYMAEKSADDVQESPQSGSAVAAAARRA